VKCEGLHSAVGGAGNCRCLREGIDWMEEVAAFRDLASSPCHDVRNLSM
jgi:hypothetical protein